MQRYYAGHGFVTMCGQSSMIGNMGGCRKKFKQGVALTNMIPMPCVDFITFILYELVQHHKTTNFINKHQNFNLQFLFITNLLKR